MQYHPPNANRKVMIFGQLLRYADKRIVNNKSIKYIMY